MSGGFRLGRIFGIEIRIDWSWLLVAVLVTWNLASGFGQIHPAWSTALAWGMGVLAALLFFSSVLAHELAHSLVAQMQGLPVRRITLFLFGGVSNIEREPPSPRAEFLIAVVGPLTSIALGILFIFLSGVGIRSLSLSGRGAMQELSNLGPLTTMLLWLGPINLLLGVFNLIPGFPLDGGRIFRSILWSLTNDLRLATRWASYLGQGVAWLMIVAGIAMVFGVEIPFFGTGLVSGLWLVFIGWFLHSASASSYQQVVLRDLLEGVPVRSLMSTEIAGVPPDMSVGRLVEHAMDSDDYSFPVLEGDDLVGMVSLQDMRATPKDRWEQAKVREIMTPLSDLDVVGPMDDTAAALSMISSRDVRHLPVVEDGRFVGVLRRRDIVRWIQLHSEQDSPRQTQIAS